MTKSKKLIVDLPYELHQKLIDKSSEMYISMSAFTKLALKNYMEK